MTDSYEDYADGYYGSCPLCDSDARIVKQDYEHDGGKYKIYLCNHCGFVGYPSDRVTFDEYIEGDYFIPHYLLAGYLYENKNGTFYVNAKNCKYIIESNLLPKKTKDYLDKICLNLYYKDDNFDREIAVKAIFPAFGYAKNIFELQRMFKELIKLKYVDIEPFYIYGDEPEQIDCYYLTYDGIKYVESLLESNKDSIRVFIAMDFSTWGEIVKNQIRDNAIKPACEEYGFEAVTADQIPHNEAIPEKIMTAIKTSRFMVADFTYNNLGVYYEAGYAKGLGIPVIKTCKHDWFKKGERSTKKNLKLHFDIKSDNLILWDNEEDLKEKLMARIETTIL